MGFISNVLKKFFPPDPGEAAFTAFSQRIDAMTWQEVKSEVDELLPKEFARVKDEIASKRPIKINPEWPESARTYFTEYPVSVFEHRSSMTGESQVSLTKYEIVGECLDEQESILLDRVTGELFQGYYDPDTEELLDVVSYKSIYHYARTVIEPWQNGNDDGE